MTLDALAEATQLDKSYLSRLERALKAPSIATLLRLAAALEVPVGELLGERLAEHAVHVTRKADRAPGPEADRAEPRFEALSRAGSAIEAFVLYPAPVFSSPADAAEHPGEELVLVLSGTIEMRFADRGFILEMGDCAQFPGHLPHRIRRVGAEPASVLVAVARSRPRQPSGAAAARRDGDSRDVAPAASRSRARRKARSADE